MPKTKVRTEDVPLWDALVAELDDPRGHEAVEVASSFVVPDDAFAAEVVSYEAAWSELDRDVDEALSELDDVERDARELLDAVMPLDEALTVVDDRRRREDARVANADTQVIHMWPIVDVEAVRDDDDDDDDDDEPTPAKESE